MIQVPTELRPKPVLRPDPATADHEDRLAMTRLACRALFAPGQAVELRIISRSGKIRAGVFDDLDVLATTAVGADQRDRPKGIYVTLNPVDTTARPATNALADVSRGQSIADAHILSRHWLLVDVDASSKGSNSATDEELAAARTAARAVRDFLTAEGWPDPLACHSGNGWHLAYKINLPNDEASKALVKSSLCALHARFGNDQIGVDTKVFNAARICKLYGTCSRKGANTDDRPWRMSSLLFRAGSEPPDFDAIQIVPTDRLASLTGAAPTPAPRPAPTPSPCPPGRNGSGSRPSPMERARMCIERKPDAISGQGGHDATLSAACTCYRFGLTSTEAREVMEWFNAHKTGGEPWSDSELEHKLADAYAKVHEAGEFGIDVRDDVVAYSGVAPAPGQTVAPKPKRGRPRKKTSLPDLENTLHNICYEDDEIQVLTPDEIADQLYKLTNGFPKRVGDSLFAIVNGRERWLNTHTQLTAWIRCFAPIVWATKATEDLFIPVAMGELHEHLAATAHAYAFVTPFPFWPERSDAFSYWKPPKDYEPTGDYLTALLSQFAPATEIDAVLLRAMFLTMAWGGPPGSRPLFFVTGDDTSQQACGKTKGVELLSSVWGGQFRLKLPKGSYGDDLGKQLTSAEAMRHRIVLLDNVTGIVRDSELADLVTTGHIDGRPSHGRQTRRANLCTYITTSNENSLSTDLASRAVVIRLRTPDRKSRPMWEEENQQFVARYHGHIIADTIHALQGTRHAFTAQPNRFATWCHAILSLSPEVDQAIEAISQGTEDVDADMDEIGNFLAELDRRTANGLSDGFRLPSLGPYTAADLATVWNAGNRDHLTAGWVVRRLKAALARGRLTAIRPERRGHGAPWWRSEALGVIPQADQEP